MISATRTPCALWSRNFSTSCTPSLGAPRVGGMTWETTRMHEHLVIYHLPLTLNDLPSATGPQRISRLGHICYHYGIHACLKSQQILVLLAHQSADCIQAWAEPADCTCASQGL